MASLQSLPAEMLRMILEYLSRQDLRQLRLVDKFLSSSATPVCFKRVEFALEDGQYEHLVQIGFHKELSQFVEELELARSPGLSPVSLPEFILQVRTYSATATLDPGSQNQDNDNNDEVEEEYEEFVAECIRLRKQAYSAAEQLSFRRTDCKLWTKRVRLAEAMPTPLDQFEEAILRFTNLKNFIHVPSFWKEDSTGRWPNLTLSNAVELEIYSGFDKRVEALQLSYVLRALGWTNHFNHNLRSMNIYVGTSSFWNAGGLKYLWEYTYRNSDSNNRRYYTSFDADFYDSDTDSSNYDLFHKNSRKELDTAALDLALYTEQISLIANSFRFLTKLVCAIHVPHLTKKMCGDMLRVFLSCVHLEWLDLTIGLLAGYFLHTDIPDWSSMDELFTNLTRATPWSNLQRLELSIVTKSRTLLSFLNSIKSTLRSLNLCNCALSDRDGPVWDSILHEIASKIPLKSLTLTSLFDFPQAWSSNPRINQQRVLFLPEGEFWPQISPEDKTGGLCYKHYYESIVNACLYYTEEHWELPPLTPLTFLREHIQDCEECRTIVFKAQQRLRESRM